MHALEKMHWHYNQTPGEPTACYPNHLLLCPHVQKDILPDTQAINDPYTPQHHHLSNAVPNKLCITASQQHQKTPETNAPAIH
jgi:hypothetical protein